MLRSILTRWMSKCGLLVILFSGTPAVFAEVYRCPTSSGDIVFSDRPCRDGQRYQAVNPIYHWKLAEPTGAEKALLDSAAPKPAKSKFKRGAACKAFTATQLRNFRVKDQLVKGMSKPYLEKRFGRPDQVEVSGNKEKWYYTELRVKRKLTFKGECLIGWKENLKNKSKISKYNE